MVLTVEVNGFFATNAYFYVDDETRAGFLIDPGAEAGKLFHIINEEALHIEKILITHGHFDHIGAAASLRNRLRVPILMHPEARKYVSNVDWNLSKGSGYNVTLDNVTYVGDGEEIKSEIAKDFGVKAIATPGHTTDGMTFYSERDHIAFVGDTIFKESFGRTDFIGGHEWTLFESIRNKIFALPDDTILYSGHTEPTTVGEEKTRPWYNV